jgi:ornithine carbamoyltransferase
MDNALRGRDLLSLGDLTPTELLGLIDAAEAQKRAWNRGGRSAPLAGKSIALIFQKPSMRTRVSFEVACYRLGAHPVVMSGPDGAFSRGETVYDTTKVLERYCDAIVIRTFAQSMVEEIAETASVPVINALTDDHHPCQGLADFLTIKEHLGRLQGVRLAYVGDGNNMANTYLLGGALLGMSVAIATPSGFDPAGAVVEQASAIAEQTGGRIKITCDVSEAVTGADVVLTDTWASMGQEAERDARIASFAPYRVDAAMMAVADPGALFMHCLPAHRGEEVTDEVIDAPCSVVFDEAENRLHAQKALLSLVLG